MKTFNIFAFCCVALMLVSCEADGPAKPEAGDPAKSEADVHVAVQSVVGGLAGGILSGASFRVRIWHQHPGALKNGVLLLLVSGHGPTDKLYREERSFKSWDPNESAAIVFEHFVVNAPAGGPTVDVHVRVTAENAQTFEVDYKWVKDDWEANKRNKYYERKQNYEYSERYKLGESNEHTK